MNPLQEEIYDTFQLWKRYPENRDFYELYVSLCLDDYPEHREHYSLYWETLKENSNDKKK